MLALSGSIAFVDSVKSVFEARTHYPASKLPLSGAFAPFFISHACACLPIPAAPPKLPNFDPLWYCAAQPLGTILHAVRKLGSIVGQTIVVVGQGQNGLLMTAALYNAGARHIVAFDRLENRLAAARAMGATHTSHVSEPGALLVVAGQVMHDCRFLL